MKKKKAIRDDEKARLEVRFDSDVYEKIKTIADAADISVNQLLHGLARWAGKNAQIGEPVKDGEGRIQNRQQPGVVWFGRPAYHYSSGVHISESGEAEPYEAGWDNGQVVFTLDYTERRVIRSDF